MKSQGTVSTVFAPNRLRHIFPPPPSSRGFDLLRRFAVAALGATRAKRLLREMGADTTGLPGGSDG